MEQLQYQLKSIRLSGMAQALQMRLQEARANDLDCLTFLRNLVEDELARRRDRLLTRRLKQARFPFARTMEEFDFGFNPGLDRRLVKELGSGAFVARHENVLLLGPPGVGKTHLAVAFGMAAIHQGFSVLYRSVFDMASELIETPTPDIVRTYVKPHLLIIDELGMKTLPPQATEILLEVIHRRYHNGSTIIATNRPIEDWGKILGDNAATSAILDRFLENIHFLKITGRSYRLKGIGKTKIYSDGKTVEKAKKKKKDADEENLDDNNQSK